MVANEKTILTDAANHKGKSGHLTLTDHRLLFEHVAGFFTKQTYSTLDLPLERILNVYVTGTFKKVLVVTAKPGPTGSFPPRLEFSLSNPENWIKLITTTSQQRVKEIEKNANPHTFDFAALKLCLEKGGVILQTLKCPECGGPITLPAEGNQVNCQYCGKTILAIDLFKRLSSLSS